MEAREPHNATARTHSGVNSELHTSPWHSPVPYLFGGLAAMLGLIAFALLVLACSYWKLLGYNENDGEGGTERDLEAGEGKGEAGRPVMEPKVLVIMAGEKKPTFLATPIGSNGSYYFGEIVKSDVAVVIKRERKASKMRKRSAVVVMVVVTVELKLR
ncbi:hypothetical protein ERO13_D13G215500v2 [Gossypium hirsutum]|uniref:Protein GLUTAMINE DUMPER 3 n=1 Tax=Gossypium hirsutum TaxID=3635 RepID=A0ABM3BEI3_GOSHI|nr:protein GLUTAMINE DUMPER 3-like [Gossypium hirsutum]KAG4113311.1 hypothetical protein ERO13_D13G215500v2 [Gossypium hirsutum]